MHAPPGLTASTAKPFAGPALLRPHPCAALLHTFRHAHVQMLLLSNTFASAARQQLQYLQATSAYFMQVSGYLQTQLSKQRPACPVQRT